MSKDKLTDAIGRIGDDLIVEAKKNRNGIILFKRTAAAAACLAVMVGAFYLALPKSEHEPADTVLQNSTTASTTLVTPTTLPTTIQPAPPSTTKSEIPTTILPGTIAPSTTTQPSTNHPPYSSSTVAPSTGNENPFAYPPLVIRDTETYDLLYTAADDISVFAQNQDFIKTFGHPDALKQFLNKLELLPIPQAEGAVCNILEYIPDYQMLNIGLTMPDGVGYSFTFELNADRAEEILEDFSNRNLISEQEWAVTGCETFKTVTEFQLLSTIFPGRYGCWMEIDGWLANFTGSNLPDSTEIDDILTQISFGDTLYWG